MEWVFVCLLKEHYLNIYMERFEMVILNIVTTIPNDNYVAKTK